MEFFSLDSSWKSFYFNWIPIWKSFQVYAIRFDVAFTVSEIIKGLKGPTSEIVTFLFYCVQENHCVQQITVSNILVCQAP